MLHTPLATCAELTTRRPWVVLSAALIVTGVAMAYSALNLRLNANTDDLIAPDQPFMDDYRELLREFGDLEYLYVVVEKPANNGTRAQQCVDFIAARLKRIEELPEIFSAIEPDEGLRIATRAMPTEELAELVEVAGAFPPLVQAAESGAAPILGAASSRLNALITEGRRMPEERQTELAAEAIFLVKSIAAALPESTSHGELAMLSQSAAQREYLRSESGDLYFIAIMPVKDYGSLHVIQKPLAQIRSVLDDARVEFPDIQMGLTGKPVLQADELATTDDDMTRASILAVALVAISFMLVLGGFWHPALAVVALLCGIVWTFGLTTIWPGQLNLLSIIFTLILVGVGIDFGAHLVTRYREERVSSSIEASMRTALLTAGRGNILGALTSSVAFLMALFTDFQGLRELGFIAGMGLLLCLASMTLVLPALLVVFDRHFPAKRRAGNSGKPPLADLEERSWHWLLQRPGLVLLIGLCVTIAILPGALRLGFEFNLLQLQARGLESVEWEHRILDDSAETWFGAVVTDSQAEALDVIERAQTMPTIMKASSVFDVIEPDSTQRDQLRRALHRQSSDSAPSAHGDDWTAADLEGISQQVGLIAYGAQMEGAAEAEQLHTLANDLKALAQLVATDSGGGQIPVRDAVDATAQRIGRAVHLMLEGDLLPLREALPRAVRGRFVSPAGSYLVALHPRENVWEFEPMGRFIADMRQVDPDVTGVPITQYESLIEMRRAFLTAALLAFGAVVILLWIDLRRVRDALLALMPLLVGVLWLVCIMGLIGLKFNLANFFAVPILIGIGVDSGIHIMRRHREDQRGIGHPQLGTTRRAVFMTSLTSLIGFGMLITAEHRGVRSLGIVMAMGAGFGLIASILVLPAVLGWLEQHRWYHGMAEPTEDSKTRQPRPHSLTRRSRRHSPERASSTHRE